MSGAAMTITHISSGSSFEALAGYSRAVVIEREGWREALVSGCTGFDYAAMSIPDGIEAQARQAFANVAAALAKAGGGLEHLVRIRVYLAAAEYFALAAPVVGEHCRAAMPANTTVVCGLVDPRMLIEVEADARIPVGVED
jgi:enamine deaminase RidA (YjgF/YER057c/UK114 family)